MKQYLKDLIKRKDLLIYLVSSGLKAEHRNSMLGYFWWLLDPLLNVLIYYIVVAIIFQSGGEGYGPYLVVGMIVWRWTNATVSSASNAIIVNSAIITQVYLPKAIFAFGVTVTQMINFAFGLIVVVIFMILFGINQGVVILWLPFIVIIQFIFLLSIALVLSFICVFFRDINNIVDHIMRIWFFGSPVIWEDRLLPESIRWITQVNPMVYFLSSYRNVFIFNDEPLFVPLIIIGLLSIVVVFFMLHYYSMNEHRIIKAL